MNLSNGARRVILIDLHTSAQRRRHTSRKSDSEVQNEEEKIPQCRNGSKIRIEKYCRKGQTRYPALVMGIGRNFIIDHWFHMNN